MKSRNASSSSSSSLNTSNATPVNSICCIDGCSRPSSIRNFSCLQGVWQVKLEHANSPNIEGLKICTTHYNEDLRQHPRVAGQGNNHHTTRKDKLRKQRLQEERKRLLEQSISLKNKDSLGTPDSDQPTTNHLLTISSNSNNNYSSTDAFPSSSNHHQQQHLSQPHVEQHHTRLKRGHKREFYDINDQVTTTTTTPAVESEANSPSNSSVSSLSDDYDSDTCINSSSMVVVSHEGTSPLRPCSSSEDNTITSSSRNHHHKKQEEHTSKLLSVVDGHLVKSATSSSSSISNNKRKQNSNHRKSINKKQSNMTEQEEDSEYILMDTKQILSIIENHSGVANFVPHVSMVYNLNNSFSFKYDLTLFREMIRLRPLNKYYLSFEDNFRTYILRMIHPSSSLSVESSSTSTTSQRHVPKILFSLSEIVTSSQQQTSNSTPQQTMNSESKDESIDTTSQVENILENNIEWLELQWGLSSLKVREREIELRCFQFYKYS
ncbi:hypothetical protein FDP41_005279 [Naegleria fowleri]|uniref:Uncharacterized protein n=1 Tax=Naegleria fowleri TaxID=5763 RepID=A0A6A5BM54_NAEFO|nr:uncharacterized protein FDP41_005279 [Naegleria fowleri]KAF0975952.1 hypothetical protein FDP41_005279 [Naegleria fowleri]